MQALLYFLPTGHAKNETIENGFIQPLLTSSEVEQNEDGDEEYNESEASEDSHKAATSITSAYRLLTPSVKVSDFTFSINFKLEPRELFASLH